MKNKDVEKGANRSRRRRRSKRSGLGYWILSLVLLALILVLPLRAFAYFEADPKFKYAVGYALFVSALTVISFQSDKRRAQLGEWRISEAVLHFLELLGGWAASFIAQRVLRHKVSKGSYQATFWCVVVLYQYAAFDFVQNWKWAKEGYAWLSPFLLG